MWMLILALIIIGLILVVLEVVFVPGTTVVGIVGVIFMGVGIMYGYRHFGDEVGLYILLGTGVATAVALFFSFRSGAWTRFANKSAIDSKVNEGLVEPLKVGDEGMAISTLKPVGKARFAAGEFEVKSVGDYVDVGTPVRIMHIAGNQIIVKQIS